MAIRDDHVALGEFVEVTPYTRVVFTWGWEQGIEVPPGSSTVEVDRSRTGTKARSCA